MELEGWFLHKIPSGETSCKVYFITKEQGVLCLWHKGGRVPKKQALLRPFMPLWLSIDQRRDYHYLRQLEGLLPPLDLRHRSLFSACYINELLYYVIKPGEAFQELYDAYQFTLHGLCSVHEPLALEALLRRFEWVLLKSCGYALDFAEEEGLEPSSLQGNAHNDGLYCYIKGRGFVQANEGEGGLTHKVVTAITCGQFTDFKALKSAKIIMRQAIDHLLDGRKLHSRGFFK